MKSALMTMPSRLSHEPALESAAASTPTPPRLVERHAIAGDTPLDTLPVDTDPAAVAVQLRRRLRSLSAGHVEAFEMVFYHLGSSHRFATVAHGAGKRLNFFAMLLADLAWVLGDHDAHDGTTPPPAPEVEALRRVFRPHSDTRRQYLMSVEQKTAVLDYLDALRRLTLSCADLDEHAPSDTLAREARRFNDEMTQLRDAVAID